MQSVLLTLLALAALGIVFRFARYRRAKRQRRLDGVALEAQCSSAMSRAEMGIRTRLDEIGNANLQFNGTKITLWVSDKRYANEPAILTVQTDIDDGGAFLKYFWRPTGYHNRVLVDDEVSIKRLINEVRDFLASYKEIPELVYPHPIKIPN